MRYPTLTLLTGLALTAVLAACQQTDVSGTTDLYNQNDADIKAYVAKKGYKGNLLASGLYFYRTDSISGSRKPAIGEEVQFNYKSYNLGDVLVDSSSATTPVYYPYGINSILAGLEQGLGLMGEGEKAIMVIPSYIGYNDRAVGTNLPAYSPVRFDVKLVRTRSESEQIDDYISRTKLPTPELSGTGLRLIRTQTNATGTLPTSGQTVTIRYSGRTLRARTAFDSTGTGTFDATLGQSKYVAGFEEGLSKLRVGEKGTIIFPSALGYGTTGVVQNNVYVITPYAPLRFDLEIISVK